MKTATFRGKRHAVTHDERLDGFATDDEIALNAALPPLAYLHTAVHEAMHRALNTQDERVIEPAAKDIARFLWRLGYRRAVGSK